jgi:hypothetical protein
MPLVDNLQPEVFETVGDATRFLDKRTTMLEKDTGTLGDIVFRPDLSIQLKGRTLDLSNLAFQQLCASIGINASFAKKLNKLDAIKLSEVNEILAKAVQSKQPIPINFVINSEKNSLELLTKYVSVLPTDRQSVEWAFESLTQTKVAKIIVGHVTQIDYLSNVQIDLDPKVGDLVDVGVSIQTSEFGMSPFVIRDYFLKLACTNGMIVASRVRDRSFKFDKFKAIADLEKTIRQNVTFALSGARNVAKRVNELRETKLNYVEARSVFGRVKSITRTPEDAVSILDFPKIEEAAYSVHPNLDVMETYELAEISTDIPVIPTWDKITSLANKWSKDARVCPRLQEFAGSFLFSNFSNFN